MTTVTASKIIPAPPRGIYVLSVDVRNPRGDRRVRHDFWRIPLWKKGSRFVVEESDVVRGAFVLRPLSRSGGHDRSLTFSRANELTLALITPHLVPLAERSLDASLLAARAIGISAETVLRVLFADGRVSLEDVDGVTRRYQEAIDRAGISS